MSRRLHILLVSFEFPPEMATGGIGAYMHHLAGLLNRNGHHVTVISAKTGKGDVETVDREYCMNYLIPSVTGEAFRYDAVQLFKMVNEKHPVDVMEGPDVGACALEIKRAFPNVPMVVKLHTPGTLINKVSNTYQPLFIKLRFVAGALRRGRFNLGYWSKKSSNKEKDHEYQVCKLADILLSPSRALKEWASRYWGIPAGKIDVIPNPFVFSKALLQLPLDNRPRQISFIGKLSVLKGMVALTGSIPAILDQFPGYRVCLVGRDELENGLSMKQYMQDKLSNYAGRIEFTGALSAEALVTIYANSQVCIFPSLWENYPTVLLEAMASGAAIAASNRGGIPEMIEDGVTGKLFDPMDPKKIVQAVSELLRDETNRLEMAARARQYLQQQQGSRLFEEKILAPYTRLALTCSHG